MNALAGSIASSLKIAFLSHLSWTDLTRMNDSHSGSNAWRKRLSELDVLHLMRLLLMLLLLLLLLRHLVMDLDLLNGRLRT